MKPILLNFNTLNCNINYFMEMLTHLKGDNEFNYEHLHM